MKSIRLVLLALPFLIFSCGESEDKILPMGEDISKIVPVVSGLVETTEDGFIVAWNKIDGAESYQVQVSLSDDFKETLKSFNNVETKDTIYIVSGVEEGDYFYRVRGKNKNTLTSYSESKTVSYKKEPVVDGNGCIYPPSYYWTEEQLEGKHLTIVGNFLYCKTFLSETGTEIKFWYSKNKETGGSGNSYEKKYKSGNVEVGSWYIIDAPDMPGNMVYLSLDGKVNNEDRSSLEYIEIISDTEFQLYRWSTYPNDKTVYTLTKEGI